MKATAEREAKKPPPRAQPMNGDVQAPAIAKPKKAKKGAAASPASPIDSTPRPWLDQLYEVQDALRKQKEIRDFHQSARLAAVNKIKELEQTSSRIITEMRTGVQGTLFDVPPAESTQTTAPPPAAEPAPIQTKPAALPPGDWQKEPIEVLEEFGMQKSHSEKLRDNRIATVGDLDQFLSGGNPIDSLNGIAEKSGEVIIKASAAFCASRRESAQPST